MADERLTTEVTADASGFVSGLKHAEEALEGFLSGLGKGNFSGLQQAMSSLGEGVGPLLAVAAAGIAVHEAFSLLSESVEETVKWNAEAGKLSRQLGITTQDASVLANSLEDHGSSIGEWTRLAGFMTRALINGSVGFKNLGVETKNADGSFRNTNDVMQEALGKLNEMPNSTEKNIIGQQLFGKSWLASGDAIMKSVGALKETDEQMTALGTKVTPEAEAASRKFSLAMADVHDVFNAFAINLGNAVIPTLTEFLEWVSGVGTTAVQAFRVGLGLLGDALNFLGTMFSGVTSAIGGLAGDIIGTLRPVLADAAEWLGKLFGGEGLDLAGAFVESIKAAVATFQTLVAVIQIAWDVAVGAFTYMKDALFAVGSAFVQAIEGNYSQALATLKAGDAVLAEDASQTAGKVEKTWTDLGARMAALSVHPQKLGAVFGPEEAPAKVGEIDTGKDKSGELVKKWKEHLDALKLEEDNWFSWDTARELAYWEEKLALTKNGTAAHRAVQAEVLKLKKAAGAEERTVALTEVRGEIEQVQRAGDEKVRTIQQTEARRIEALKEASDEASAIAKNKAEVGKLTDPEHAGDIELAALRAEKVAQDQLAKEISDLRAKDLADEKAALDRKMLLQHLYFDTLRSLAAGDAKELAKIKTDEVKAEDTNLKAKKALEDKADLEEAKSNATAKKRELDLALATNKKIAEDQAKTSKQIEGYLQPFVAGFSNGLKKILDGSLSLGQAVKGMGQMLVGAFTDMIGNMVTEWIASLGRMLAQWLAHLLIQETAQKTSDATAMATGAATRTAEAAGNAAVMATAAGASVAAIPLIGWTMWPGVMAGAYAAGMAMVPAAAASQGFDIPAGLNPVTQLHAREMVLPANIADAVRGMASGGGGSTSSSSRVIHIHAVDAKSFERMLRGPNGGAATKVAKDFMRDRRGR